MQHREWKAAAAVAVARMCSLHDCCDYGIHSERNTPSLRHRPDRSRQITDSSFGSVKQTTVSQPREVTGLSSRPDRHDRRDKPLLSHSDSHMNSRSDINSNSKHVIFFFSCSVSCAFNFLISSCTKVSVCPWSQIQQQRWRNFGVCLLAAFLDLRLTLPNLTS